MEWELMKEDLGFGFFIVVVIVLWWIVDLCSQSDHDKNVDI